jgi:hypothetical protein
MDPVKTAGVYYGEYIDVFEQMRGAMDGLTAIMGEETLKDYNAKQRSLPGYPRYPCRRSRGNRGDIHRVCPSSCELHYPGG